MSFKPGERVRTKIRENVRIQRFGCHERVWLEAGSEGTVDWQDGGCLSVRFDELKSVTAKKHGGRAPGAVIWESNLEPINALDQIVREIE